MDSTNNTSPLGFFLGHALATLGSDAAYYYGNQLTQDSPQSELALYQGTQNGYALQAGQSAALRGQPAVAARASLDTGTVLVLAVIIGVVILAAKSK